MNAGDELRLTYYPWIAQHITPEDLRRAVEEFTTIAQEELNRLTKTSSHIRVLPAVDVPVQVGMIADGGCDIALTNPLGYVFAHGRNPGVLPILVALREIDGKVGPTYYAQLYTLKKSAIRPDPDGGLRRARGRTLGFGTPYSTSNFLVPARLLQDKGLHPFAGFARVEFVGGHDLVAQAVYEGRVDIGAGHDGVIKDLARQYGYGDAEERIMQLVRSEPIPSDPVAVNIPNAEMRRRVADAFAAAAGTPRGSDALKRFWGDVRGLEPVLPEAYDAIEASLASLSLKESNLLR